MPERGVRVAAALLLLAAGACSDGESADPGGSPPSVTCESLLSGLDFPADCSSLPGGDWELVRYCPFPDGFDPLGGTCEAARYETSGRATAQLELRDNGLFRFVWQERLLELQSTIPTRCYGDGDFCRGSALGGTCGVESDICRCSETRIELERLEQGNWTATPGQLRFEASAGLSLDQHYCVDRTLGWMVVERPAAAGLPGARLLFRRR